MFSMTSAAIYGIRAVPVSVETDVASGIPQFTIVGLPDTSVRESRDRIRSAMRNSGFSFPRGRVTVNLAPAHLRKQGVIYDLAIALSILARSGEINIQTTERAVVLGELGLHGEVRPVQGILPVALMAKAQEKPILFVPKQNAQEAALVPGISVFGIGSLREFADHLNGTALIESTDPEARKIDLKSQNCFSEIRGQAFAKRGLEIAAAGGHNVLLQGPPGTGKTMLARAFPSILPPLSDEEAIEVAAIRSIAGLKAEGDLLSFVRPFRAPHHSCSAISLIGGGTWPSPGEVSLAHHGVLFLDELPEFGRHVLETLRQPLEDGAVTIARAAGAITFPARFQLLATRNPCPCGYLNDPKRRCECGSREIQAYERRVSGPLLDRIDLVIDVPNIETTDLAGTEKPEPSITVQKRVMNAWGLQATLPKQKQTPPLTASAKTLLDTAFSSGLISTRGYFRIQRVARTIASLDASDSIEEQHVAESIQFRLREKKS